MEIGRKSQSYNSCVYIQSEVENWAITQMISIKTSSQVKYPESEDIIRETLILATIIQIIASSSSLFLFRHSLKPNLCHTAIENTIICRCTYLGHKCLWLQLYADITQHRPTTPSLKFWKPVLKFWLKAEIVPFKLTPPIKSHFLR